MNIKSITLPFAEFWQDFKKERAGLVGLGILLVSLIIVLFEPLFLPFGDVNKTWRNIAYWEDSPAAAPPVWTNWFNSKKGTRSANLSNFKLSSGKNSSHEDVQIYSLAYEYTADIAPSDLIFRANVKGAVFMDLFIDRPDGAAINLGQIQRNVSSKEIIRFSVQNDARSAVRNFAQEFGARPASGSERVADLIFSQGSPAMYREKLPLKGEYTFRIIVPKAVAQKQNFVFEEPRLIIAGKVSGLLGTDTQKRDIFSGIIAGLKWALFIGLVASVLSVLIGVLYGIISAYFGGIADWIMSFIFEIFVSVPVLPILIVASAIFKPSIWLIVIALIVFYWVGQVKTVRSLAMQVKEETYIEAARALGASSWRIIFKHLFPLLLPYSFASMALNVPAAIVFESSLSLLGLGDPSIVTWGQILHDAQSAGATLNGLWWWIVPPGLSIALMGMTFAFLGFAMDKILHPKLRTR